MIPSTIKFLNILQMSQLFLVIPNALSGLMMEKLTTDLKTQRPTSSSCTLKQLSSVMESLLIVSIKLNGIPVAAALEKLLLDAANGGSEDTSNIPEILTLYAKFIDIPHLTIQLKMMPDLVKAYNKKHPPIHNVKNLPTL